MKRSTVQSCPAAPSPVWTFGDTSLSRIVESEEPLLSPYEIFPDCTEEHIRANLGWLAPHFFDAASQLLVITIQSFLIRRPGLTILVDACSGDHKQRVRPFFHQREWPWLDRLRATGVAPEDVDLVLCSHLHVDHVGWNTRLDDGRWVPTFPNARYLVSQREWDFWRSDAGKAAMQRTGDYVVDSVLPVAKSGQMDLVGDHLDVAPGIAIEPAHGHTPGHYVVRLREAAKEAILSGDIMHHPLQLRYPDWSTRFCADADRARTTRHRFLAENAGSNRLVLPAHFPSPTAGFIEREQDHYRFRDWENP